MEFAEFIKIPQVSNVVLTAPNLSSLEGTLCVASHYLILASHLENQPEFWLLYRNVDSVERKGSSSRELTLCCKDFRVLKFQFTGSDECAKVAESIDKLSRIAEVNLLYPFFYNPKFHMLENGWLAFTLEAEYAKYRNSPDLRLTNINTDFKVCRSYPRVLVVPKSVDDETIVKAAKFRHYERFPVLSYAHKSSGTYLVRSSQPLVGTSNRRSREDEVLLNAYVVPGKNSFVIDTRKASLAKASHQKGGGYESDSAYPQWKRIHQPVQRWNHLSESLSLLIEACTDSGLSMDKYLNKLNSSHWLDYSRDILICACVVSDYIHQDGATVLVHGSAGTDTTLQVTSMSQLILDPDCRTIRGFEALVEREWVLAGHPFQDRCSNSAFSRSSKKMDSPVFLLFLDCVWQVWQQYPCSFEFNENFLIELFENAYCSNFGTFLCNNALEKRQLKVMEKTISLWSYMNRPEILKDFLNPLYEPNGDVLSPSVVPQSLSLWQSLYMRSQIDPQSHSEVWSTISHVKETNNQLQLKTGRLRRQIDALSKELQEEGVSSTDVLVRSTQ